MPSKFVGAVDLLRSLGITEPDEIDVYAIAQSTGATVVGKPVTGCEARIIGYGDKAPDRREFGINHIATALFGGARTRTLDAGRWEDQSRL